MQGPIIDFILITGQGSGGSRCDALVSNDGASICHDICRYDRIHCAAGGHHLTTRVSRLLRRRGPAPRFKASAAYLMHLARMYKGQQSGYHGLAVQRSGTTWEGGDGGGHGGLLHAAAARGQDARGGSTVAPVHRSRDSNDN